MEEHHIIKHEAPPTAEDSLAERKARLLRQAEFYRVGIVHARHSIREGARPEAMFHSALDHATWAVRSRVDKVLHPTGVTVSSIMPYAATILGFLNRRRLIKPALAIVAVVAGVAYFIERRRARLAH
ncbi:MAG: hypothetical protein V4633_10935 [Pseudomonadota bacterium]